MSMKTIHKHELTMTPETQTLELAKGARVLAFEFISNRKTLFMWVEVVTDLNAETEERKFRVFKSGDGIPEADQHIASTVDQYIPESYHLYEIP